MIYTIIAAVVFFLIVILTLVSVLFFAKAKLLPSGEVTLTINGQENITINPGGTILGTLGDKDDNYNGEDDDGTYSNSEDEEE